MQLATDLDVVGARVFDLQMALVAFEGGATELWTHDARFGRIPGLRVHDPLSMKDGGVGATRADDRQAGRIIRSVAPG